MSDTKPEQAAPPPAFARVLLPFAPVLAGGALNGFAAGALSVLIGVRLAASGAPATAIGIVLACHFAGLILGARLCPRLIAETGHVRAFGVFAAGACVLTLLLSMTESFLAWGILRIGTGLCMAGLFTVVESWLNQQVASNFRARTFAVYMILGTGAAGLAPLTLNVIDPFRYELFSVIAIAFVLAPMAMTLTAVRIPVSGGASTLRLRALLAVSPGGVIACFGHGLVNSALYQVSPVYFAKLGFDHARLSIFLAAANIAGVALQWPVGWLADRIGRHPLLLGQALIAGSMALWLSMLAAPSFGIVLGVGVVIAAMAHPFYSLGVAIANDRLAQQDFVDAASGLILLWAAGAAIGPIVATVLIDGIGPRGLFFHVGIAALGLAGVVLHRMLARPPAPPSARPPVPPAAT